MFEQLRPHLFPDDGTYTYAILDGASIPDLLDALDTHQPEYVCLYAGELEPDVEECAPYLVRLDPDSEFTRWVIDEGWGKHWGIFATSPADLRALRKHLRSLLLVKSPEEKTLYFRYYDPRVLNLYLPTAERRELLEIFGPLKNFLLEHHTGATLTTYHVEAGRLVSSAVGLAAQLARTH
jgi:hypothetical protein